MWMNLLLLIGGLALILIGANGLTDGAASVAKRFLYLRPGHRIDHRSLRNLCSRTGYQRTFLTTGKCRNGYR